MVICLERDADMHMAQLMPLPLTVSCFSKIQIGFTFLGPAHPGSPGKRAIKRVCVCMVFIGQLCYFCVLHGNAGDKQRKALSQFLQKWPSVESALGATWQEVHRRLEPYGVTPDTAKTLLRFCGQCAPSKWTCRMLQRHRSLHCLTAMPQIIIKRYL